MNIFKNEKGYYRKVLHNDNSRSGTPTQQLNRELKKLQNAGIPFIVERPSANERILWTLNKKAKLELFLSNNNRTINLETGSTNKNKRGKGYGIFLRAIPLLAAKNTNFTKFGHTAVWVNLNQKSKYLEPPSGRLTRYLGFTPLTYKNTRVKVLHKKNMNTKKIRNIVEGRFNKKNYNRFHA